MRIMRGVLQFICRILFRVSVVGDCSPLTTGKSLVIANHGSFLDGPLLALFLPRHPLVVLSRADMRHWLVRFMAPFVRHVVVDLSEPSIVRQMVRLLDGGEVVVMFPQGRIATAGSVMKFYDSVAAIALRSRAAVIPVFVQIALYSVHTRGGSPFRYGWVPRSRSV